MAKAQTAVKLNATEHPYDVAILLTTRKRDIPLKLCLTSIVNRAARKDRIQLIISFDEDDLDSFLFFNKEILPWLKEKGVNTKTIICERFGYLHLNKYYNVMAKLVDASWLMMWNDDALMDTDGWDREIAKYTGQFKLLSVFTNNDHPYSVFPIIPIVWFQLLGQMTRHQEVDHEISQIGYLLDIYQRIPVYVTHDRADLTGNNNDQTYLEREWIKDDENDIRHFNNPVVVSQRCADIDALAEYMRFIGMSTSWWDEIKAGNNPNPFLRLIENDVNLQCLCTRQAYANGWRHPT